MQDLGTHSAHCAADRGLSQVQFLAGCGRACCCAVTGALVGRAENCGVSAVAVVLGVVQFLDKVVVPVGATTGSAQYLVRLWIHAPFYQGGLWKNLYDFLREGVDSDPVVNSRRFSPCSHAEDEVAALVVNNVSGMFFGWYCWFLHLALCSRRCGMTACTR